ncbi:MAG: class I SAM-dependent methyltransferase [Aureliella sp.]
MNDPQIEIPAALNCEQLLLDSFPKWSENRLTGLQTLVISPGLAQTAGRLAEQKEVAEVHAWHMDLHDAAQTAALWDHIRNEAVHQPAVDIEVLSGADLPENGYGLIAMAILKRGEAELTRELLQQSHDRLETGGWLVCSVDNPKDTWLHDQLKPLFPKVTAERLNKGCVYWARKNKPLKKQKNFESQFEFRDRDQTFKVVTRPGVFSHRRLDPAAKQLMLSSDIGPTDNVLEMGCGSGAVSLSAASCTSGTVFAVDSNARAIQCLKKSAEMNGLENIQTIWNADGEIELGTPIDLAFANPPYFGDDLISQHFVDCSLAALRVGGALLTVTKQPGWYEAYYDSLGLEDIAIFEAGNYFVACGRKSGLLGEG